MYGLSGVTKCASVFSKDFHLIRTLWIHLAWVFCKILSIGGSKRALPARHPTVQNFLNHMQFLGNFKQIVCWSPLLRVGAPSYENPGSDPVIVLDVAVK